MVPSIYVIQKSSGMRYCVSVKHYEEYKHWYDLPDPPKPVEVVVEEEKEEVVEVVKQDPLSNFDVSAVLTTKKNTRTKKEK